MNISKLGALFRHVAIARADRVRRSFETRFPELRANDLSENRLLLASFCRFRYSLSEKSVASSGNASPMLIKIFAYATVRTPLEFWIAEFSLFTCSILVDDLRACWDNCSAVIQATPPPHRFALQFIPTVDKWF